MSIEISTQKIVRSDGVLGRRITGIKILKFENLPKMYTTDGKPAVISYDGTTLQCCKSSNDCNFSYSLNEFYPEDKIQALIEHCKVAGEHLRACNKKLKAAREEWNGRSTFII